MAQRGSARGGAWLRLRQREEGEGARAVGGSLEQAGRWHGSPAGDSLRLGQGALEEGLPSVGIPSGDVAQHGSPDLDPTDQIGAARSEGGGWWRFAARWRRW